LLSKLIIIICAIAGLNPSWARTKDFETLRYMLSARSEEPKIYLPSSGFLGSEMEILVVAPTAKSIRLLASTNPGKTQLDGMELALGGNLQEIGTVAKDKANFKINLDPLSKKNNLLGAYDYTGETKNNLYFEALVSYDDGKGGEITKPAHFYGANANFTNQNAVEIKAPAKDSSSVSNMARTFLPGLIQAGSGNARY
jgi:hypothetical protein